MISKLPSMVLISPKRSLDITGNGKKLKNQQAPNHTRFQILESMRKSVMLKMV
jgi:hypothetical protein